MSDEFIPPANDLIPPAFGPGSQPTDLDGEKLDYMEMPREMATFDLPIAPEPEDTNGMEAGKQRLNDIQGALKKYQVGLPAIVFELDDLDKADLGLVNQILGEGEVSIVCGSKIQAQESVLAGVWRVLHFSAEGDLLRDTIEVADYPDAVEINVFANSCNSVDPLSEALPNGVFNAPSLVSELEEKQGSYKPGDAVHNINLTLLPQTEEDLMFLADKLGVGGTVILSRGYGNCRVSSTNTKNVWWVQYYNSQDTMILNSIEIIDIPEVVCAAQEDIEDSAERLYEIMDTYK